MTFTQVETAVVKPGKMDDVVRLTEQTRSTLANAGATDFSLHRAIIGGPATGSIFWAIDYEDSAAWGKAYDVLSADKDWAELLDRVWGPNGVVTRQNSELLEVDRHFGMVDRPSQPGSVSMLSQWRVTPGRLDDARKTTAALAEYFIDLGGHSVTYRYHIAGQLSGLYALTTQFPDMTSLGEWQRRQQTNPEIQRIFADFMAANVAIRNWSLVSRRVA